MVERRKGPSGISEAELGAVVEELEELRGAIVQRAWAPSERVVVLGLRIPKETRLLLIHAVPPLIRLHLTRERPRPAGEPAVFQYPLRAELEGLLLSSITKLPGDRVVEFSFSGRHVRRLVAELTGRGSNVYLLDDAGLILHAAGPSVKRRRRVSAEAGAEEREPTARRENAAGTIYAPPPPPPSSSGRAIRPELRTPPGAPFAMNEAADSYFAPLEQSTRVEESRRAVLRPLRGALTRIDRALARLDEEAKRASEAGTYLRYGELLKTELHKVRRGAGEIRVTDWYSEGQPETIVPLREELSPKENMERYFKLARRLGSATGKVEERRRELLDRRPLLEEMIAAAEGAKDEGAVGLVRRAAEERGLIRVEQAQEGAKAAKEKRRPYRRYLSLSGRPILVGKGSADNDSLTFKVARGNDVWIHVRGSPGSHVVVPTAELGEPDQETLLDAATLAAHFSRARGEAVVDVAWTHRKHVRKPKGASPGLVTVSQERGLLLRLEPERLGRLLSFDAR